jgi:hypothetical protein
MKNTFQLTPINGRKSFGGKCRVIEENGLSQLESYDTVVAEYNHRTNKMVIFKYYSATTATHINAFLSYYGFDTCTKKELENYNN